MSLADDLHEAQQAANQPQYCKTGAWIQTLTERDLHAIEAFLAAGKPLSHLHRLAIRNGCPAAETRFRNHFRRRCTCYTLAEVAA